jgi:hypothetical protein
MDECKSQIEADNPGANLDDPATAQKLNSKGEACMAAKGYYRRTTYKFLPYCADAGHEFDSTCFSMTVDQ